MSLVGQQSALSPLSCYNIRCPFVSGSRAACESSFSLQDDPRKAAFLGEKGAKN